MLPVPYHRQPNDYSCGPASLRMVLAYFGIASTIATLAEQSGTTEERGTTHAAMLRTARRQGLRASEQADSSLALIRKNLAAGLPTIVNYVEPDGEEGHYAVAVDLSATHITLHDPWVGEGFRLTTKEFLRRWRSMDGRSRRWTMTVRAPR